jgi:hypothetical protein
MRLRNLNSTIDTVGAQALSFIFPIVRVIFPLYTRAGGRERSEVNQMVKSVGSLFVKGKQMPDDYIKHIKISLTQKEFSDLLKVKHKKESEKSKSYSFPEVFKSMLKDYVEEQQQPQQE